MIKPKVRNNMCMNVDPQGLTKPVVDQIDFVKQSMADATDGPKRVLILGGSGGYGLASRIAATFGYGADTISISYEREPSERRDGTPGWYNNEIFDKLATEAGHKAISLNADAFANATREQVAELIRTELGQVDLVVYSLAAPVRPDPETGELYRSTIKPITEPYDAVTVDVMTGDMKPINIPVATEEEVASTVKVMGGEDWALWTDYLLDQGLLADGATTVAYSYIGPEITRLIYRSGALGKAKQHLEGTAAALSEKLSVLGGRAYVSVNKALVTRASAVIPTMPVYIAALYKVMKAKAVHEGCIEQIVRLFTDRLYGSADVLVDEAGRIRLDDWEMRKDVQDEVDAIMENMGTTANIEGVTDLVGYRREFLELHGFDPA